MLPVPLGVGVSADEGDAPLLRDGLGDPLTLGDTVGDVDGLALGGA